MRDIKFRAWSKFWNELYYFDFEKCIEVREGGLWVKHKNGSTCVNQPSVELMQYTGLKDKNGKEIYEGDIVKTEDDDSFTKGIVFFDDDGFKCTSAYYNNIKDYSIYDHLNKEFINDNLIVVIGNIYENPDLLT